MKNLLRGLIVVYIITSLVYFFTNANFNKKDDLQNNNLSIDAEVKFLNSIPEFISFLGTPSGRNDRLDEDLKNLLILKIKWEESITSIEGSPNLYYPPYIIIIPPNDNLPISGQWVYAGTNINIPLISSRSTTAPAGIVQTLLRDAPEYDWERMGANPFATVFSAKSFGQGMIEVAFMNNNIPDYPQTFQGYFVYYNPTTKKGWAKPFEVQYQPVSKTSIGNIHLGDSVEKVNNLLGTDYDEQTSYGRGYQGEDITVRRYKSGLEVLFGQKSKQVIEITSYAAIHNTNLGVNVEDDGNEVLKMFKSQYKEWKGRHGYDLIGWFETEPGIVLIFDFDKEDEKRAVDKMEPGAKVEAITLGYMVFD